MSARTMCSMRCRVWRLSVTDVDGAPSYEWAVVATGIPVRVDVFGSSTVAGATFVVEAGTASDLQGTAFFLADHPCRAGDRIEMTRGFEGKFQLGGKFVKIFQRRGRIHHFEVEITEVAKILEGAP